MLTLALAQIVWSVVFQWDSVTGGSNGLVGIWPAEWLASPGGYFLALVVCALSVGALGASSARRSAKRFARAATSLRSEAIGINVRA